MYLLSCFLHSDYSTSLITSAHNMFNITFICLDDVRFHLANCIFFAHWETQTQQDIRRQEGETESNQKHDCFPFPPSTLTVDVCSSNDEKQIKFKFSRSMQFPLWRSYAKPNLSFAWRWRFVKACTRRAGSVCSTLIRASCWWSAFTWHGRHVTSRFPHSTIRSTSAFRCTAPS